MVLITLFISLFYSPVMAEQGGYDPASGSLEVRVAEHSRLSSEIRSLAQKSAWKGVDRNYDRIALLRVEMSWEDHVYGAHAASELGEISETRARLYAAVQIRPEKGLIDWLWELDHSYGSVQLKGVEGAVLEAGPLPLDPVQRRSIEQAIISCAETGSFEGMIPEGSYRFDGLDFRVEHGEVAAVGGPLEPSQRRFLRGRD
jgi:hypothetical protein